MHILFLTEQYHYSPEFGQNMAITKLINSYECTRYGTYENVFLCSNGGMNSKQVTQTLLDKDYDLACLSFNYGQVPSMEDMEILVKNNKKLVIFWYESVLFEHYGENQPEDRKWWKYAKYYPQILLDYPAFGEIMPNVLCLESPEDTRVFNKDGCCEVYDVGFCGCLYSRPERRKCVEYLQSHGINVIAAGGLGPGRSNLSIPEYANIIKRSKICLNFNIGHGLLQRKGRPFEIAACGKLILSDFNTVMNGWFVEDKEYVGFTPENLVYKIYHYLESSDRDIIANNAYERYIKEYSPIHTWKKIFDIARI